LFFVCTVTVVAAIILVSKTTQDSNSLLKANVEAVAEGLQKLPCHATSSNQCVYYWEGEDLVGQTNFEGTIITEEEENQESDERQVEMVDGRLIF
jgi:hypothetical protein